MEAQSENSTSDAEDLEEFVDDFDDDDDDDDDDDNFEEEEREDDEMESLVRRLSAEERVVIRVNDVIIKGNTRTSSSLVAAEVEPIFREASSFRQLLLAAAAANARLQHLGLFDSVTITLDAGPPGTANVVVEVSEANNRLTGDLGIYYQPEEFDIRCAIPLGIYRAAFNFGISGGIIFPCGSGNLNAPSYVPERSFLGDNSSPVCSLRGPTPVLGFKARGLDPAEPRRLVREYYSDGTSDIPEVDHIGGDIALTAFTDFSFDLPLRVLQEAGVHGHIFACTGSLNRLSENAYKEFSFQKFRDSFRSWAGLGIVIPTKLFRMEVNYCHILKQQEHDRVKTGLQFSFSRL